MKTISVSEFIDHLKANDLVIAPRAKVTKDLKHLQFRALQKNMLSFSEISKAELWGKVSQKRVYQLAMQYARDGDVIMVKHLKKITKSAVERIARERNIIWY